MQPGDVIAERYRLDAQIGEGAMGVVWRASVGDRQVAIKLMHASYAAQADARARFAREARVAAALHHPSSVGVLDYGDSNGALFLVMELLVGRSLRDLLMEREGSLTVREAAAIGAQVAAALAAAHQINLVHRDIKPENTFLEEADTHVRVVDFGLAFITSEANASLGRLTETGVVGGTPSYMSPEQARGLLVGPPADVYSLGCMVYEMIAGRPPFGGAIAEMITRHAYVAPIPMRKMRPELAIPAGLDDLVLAMLAKSPPMRPPPTAIVSALEAIAADEPGPATEKRDRAARMVKPGWLTDPTMPHTPDGGTRASKLLPRVAWIGAWDEELALALAANELDVDRSIAPADAAIVFAPGASVATLVELVASGRPVVTDVAPGDLPGIADRLRAGVKDVVTFPVRADDLARKLRRALRR